MEINEEKFENGLATGLFFGFVIGVIIGFIVIISAANTQVGFL